MHDNNLTLRISQKAIKQFKNLFDYNFGLNL
jgi:hypothetical protein